MPDRGSGLMNCFRPCNSLPSLNVVADAAHPYPATRIAFQPSTLDDGSTSQVNPSTRYSATSKSAKRASWGTAYALQGSPEDQIDEDILYPDRELLATTADCLRVWECMREEEDPNVNSYVGERGQKKSRYGLREKSVLAHVSGNTHQEYTSADDYHAASRRIPLHQPP
jgi:WD repeat-containing protein 68